MRCSWCQPWGVAAAVIGAVAAASPSLSAGLSLGGAAHPLPGPAEEIKAHLDPFPRATPGHPECAFRLRDVKPPAAVDWRDHGVVAPVKDQEGVSPHGSEEPHRSLKL